MTYSKPYHSAVALQKLLIERTKEKGLATSTLVSLVKEWRELEATKAVYRKRKREIAEKREAANPGNGHPSKRSAIPEGIEP